MGGASRAALSDGRYENSDCSDENVCEGRRVDTRDHGKSRHTVMTTRPNGSVTGCAGVDATHAGRSGGGFGRRQSGMKRVGVPSGSELCFGRSVKGPGVDSGVDLPDDSRFAKCRLEPPFRFEPWRCLSPSLLRWDSHLCARCSRSESMGTPMMCS